MIRTTFAQAGYENVDIISNGKVVKIFDIESCEYYATGYY